MAGEGAIGLLFVKGVVLCSSIAAPVGPMALLCLRTTLAFGFVPGLMGGLGVAAGDTFYASLAAFGLQAATAILTGQSLWLGMLGGLYLVWFGVGTMRQPLPEGTRRGLRYLCQHLSAHARQSADDRDLRRHVREPWAWSRRKAA